MNAGQKIPPTVEIYTSFGHVSSSDWLTSIELFERVASLKNHRVRALGDSFPDSNSDEAHAWTEAASIGTMHVFSLFFVAPS